MLFNEIFSNKFDGFIQMLHFELIIHLVIQNTLA